MDLMSSSEFSDMDSDTKIGGDSGGRARKVRLGAGGYGAGGDWAKGSDVLGAAQSAFVRAILNLEEASVVFETLRSDVFPIYAKTFEERRKAEPFWMTDAEGRRVQVPPLEPPSDIAVETFTLWPPALRDAVRAWAVVWGLETADWLIEQVVRWTLWDWYESPRARQALSVAICGESEIPIERLFEVPFPIEVIEGSICAYRPTRVSRQEVEQGLAELISRAKRAKRELRRKPPCLDQDDSYQRTPQKDRDHFKWAVRYQCLKEGVSLIAKSVNASPETVDVAIKDVLEKVRVKRRSGRGRPRKT